MYLLSRLPVSFNVNFHSTLSIIDMAIESKEKLSKKKKKKSRFYILARVDAKGTEDGRG